ncbi:hypothetical protein [Modestobacter versicolor]|uniref:hypothetical protein n=1 Tax=Modestobacter versicolor TaxID=429133 RepID=UPI0034DEE3A2
MHTVIGPRRKITVVWSLRLFTRRRNALTHERLSRPKVQAGVRGISPPRLRTPTTPTTPARRRRAGSPIAANQLRCMRAVQFTRFGVPEVTDVVDLPDPVPGDGEQLFDISSSGVEPADAHHRLSRH